MYTRVKISHFLTRLLVDLDEIKLLLRYVGVL